MDSKLLGRLVQHEPHRSGQFPLPRDILGDPWRLSVRKSPHSSPDSDQL